MIRRPPRSTLFPTRRSSDLPHPRVAAAAHEARRRLGAGEAPTRRDRKSTRLNSSHSQISYAVFCLKKKKSPSLGIVNMYSRCVTHHLLLSNPTGTSSL